MSKHVIYREPNYTLPRLPIGTLVFVETQGLVPWADLRYGRVTHYDEDGNVQVFLSEVRHGGRDPRPAAYVWLYPTDVTQV